MPVFPHNERSAIKKLRKDLRSGFYSFMVLSILEKEGDLHGYAIRKNLETLSEGKLVPSEGTLYDLLKSLRKYGLVEDFQAEVGGRFRRYYRITNLGRKVLAELRDEVHVLMKTLSKVL
ncbi:helix-turn-helix transcriptional regulator [Geoglobus acetivorans]|uniref:PadR family transcriptional regulator n=1 Tax=Geoglobus acetivorans TaxID=565033 RepID=A0ABZ3H276_GEOAI|nr:PadR family transcriptional regulator [Geoglobus acetivorans]